MEVQGVQVHHHEKLENCGGLILGVVRKVHRLRVKTQLFWGECGVVNLGGLSVTY